jgi:hypothetical protein
MSARHSKFCAPVAVLLLLVIGACSRESSYTAPPLLDVVLDGPVRPIVQSATAVPGATVSVQFQNTVATEFWFNPCERFVELHLNNRWTRLPDELRVCNAMAYILQPNSQRVELVDVPGGLEPGTYRFVFVMRSSRSPDVAHYPASTTFEVRVSSLAGAR